MVHEIGPTLRTVTLHQAYGVYKDYDGNCPDSGFFAVCATQELAKEVAGLLRKYDPNSRNKGEDDECPDDRYAPIRGEYVDPNPENWDPTDFVFEKPKDEVPKGIAKTEETEEGKMLAENAGNIGWPGCEGWEWSACWLTKETTAERVKIATTLAEAIRQIVGP